MEPTYDAVARLINCGRHEIAIVENATRAWDTAFYSLRFKLGDRLLTTEPEYASNYLAEVTPAPRRRPLDASRPSGRA